MEAAEPFVGETANGATEALDTDGEPLAPTAGAPPEAGAAGMGGGDEDEFRCSRPAAEAPSDEGECTCGGELTAEESSCGGASDGP
jgi:hypothetical protein